MNECTQAVNLKGVQGRPHQFLFVIVSPGQGHHRIIPAFMKNAVLVLSESPNSVSVIQIPDLRELHGIFFPNGPELVSAASKLKVLRSEKAYTCIPYTGAITGTSRVDANTLTYSFAPHSVSMVV